MHRSCKYDIPLTPNSSLGFLLPSQYGTNLYESESSSKSLVLQ